MENEDRKLYHEVCNHAQVVMGNAELLERVVKDDENALRYVEKIKRAVEKLAHALQGARK